MVKLVIELLTAVFGVAGQSISKWLESKQIEKTTKLEIKKIEAQGKVEQAKALAQIEAEYDNYAQMSMKESWKDEFLVIILVIPFLVSFFTPYISVFFGIDLTLQLSQAWELVGKAPDWYQWSFMGIIIATFGLRWMTKHKIGKIQNTTQPTVSDVGGIIGKD